MEKKPLPPQSTPRSADDGLQLQAPRSLTPPKFAVTAAPSTQPLQKKGDPQFLHYDSLAKDLQTELSKSKKSVSPTTVFSLLDQLDQDPAAVEGLNAAYTAISPKKTLQATLEEKLSKADFAHADMLIVWGRSAQFRRPAMNWDFATLASDAKSILGAAKVTAKKKMELFDIFAKLKHDPELLQQLKDAYAGDLMADVAKKFKGGDLNYLTKLLTGAPVEDRVNVANDAEEAEVRKIIAQIKADYGIDLDSSVGTAGEATMSKEAPQALKDQARTAAWEYRELVALQKALARFAPILGDKRAASSDAAVPQKITKFAKMDQSINTNNAGDYILDNSTGGMNMQKQKAIAMYTAVTTGNDSELGDAFANNEEFIQGNMIHELAHAFIGPKVDKFMKCVLYWKDPITADIDPVTKALRNPQAEAPITKYGQTSASEDLAEAAKYYFLRPKEMADKFPKRFQFMEDVVKGWKPKAKP